MPVIEVKQQVWVPEIPDIELPSEDGEPLESNWHRLQINLSCELVYYRWQDRTDYFVGGNMFVYYSFEQARNRDYKGPDIFVVRNVDGSRSRPSWIVWQEGGRYPDVIIELPSPTTASEDLGAKKDLYEQVFKTSEYFCVDPETHTLQGWQLEKCRYIPKVQDDRGWLWSDTLEVWLGFEAGSFQGYEDKWVRFFDADGHRILIAQELAELERERAETERGRADAAESELARLRAELERRGVPSNPDVPD